MFNLALLALPKVASACINNKWSLFEEILITTLSIKVEVLKVNPGKYRPNIYFRI